MHIFDELKERGLVFILAMTQQLTASILVILYQSLS